MPCLGEVVVTIPAAFIVRAREALALTGAPDAYTASVAAVLRWARRTGFGVRALGGATVTMRDDDGDTFRAWLRYPGKKRPGQWGDRARVRRARRRLRAGMRRLRVLEIRLARMSSRRERRAEARAARDAKARLLATMGHAGPG